MILYETIRFRGEPALQAVGSTGPVRDLVLPGTAQEDGTKLPVRSIAGHAFAGRKELRSVSLPEELKTIRSFAFYDCTSLSSLELYNTTDDYYDGVIRQCPSLALITVHCPVPDNYIIVREMLSDVDGTLRFRLLTEEGELRLVFPEYVSEAKEDTMARAIHFSIEGAGMAYRECVGKKTLNLQEYDHLLYRLTDYDFEAAEEIALGRLGFPTGLSASAAEEYRTFLRENDEKALSVLAKEEETEKSVRGVQIMADQNLIGTQALGSALELASQRGRVRIASVLMEYRSRRSPGQGSTIFSLNW